VRVAPNRETVAGRRASPWGGGDGNDGGRKCAEDRGSSVTGVDERSASVAMGGGERGRGRGEESAAQRLAPFDAEVGEGWGSRVRCRVEEQMGQRGGAGFSDVDRHGTDAAHPGRSNSGGRAASRGGQRGASDAGAMG
jgi:hypothetical protein